MKTLVLGGVKSGKSRFAESLASNSHKPVHYLATATADDQEMLERIRHHQAQRPSGWNLIEEPLSVGEQIQALNFTQNCVLLDCLTLWLTNCLINDDPSRFPMERAALIKAVSEFQGTLVMVSNESNQGITPMGALSRRYCDEAGLMHQELASLCDLVVVTMAGLPLYLKGNATMASG